MASRTRYDPSGIQAEFEPGSRGRVLRNLLGIKRVGDINEAESQTLLLAQAQAIERYGDDQRFTAQDICDLHRLCTHGRDYAPLTAMFERVISQTWTQHAASSAR